MVAHWLAIGSQQPPHCSRPQAGSAPELLKQIGQLLVSITFSQSLHALLHLLEQLGIGIGLAKARPKQSLDGLGEDGLVRIVLMHNHSRSK